MGESLGYTVITMEKKARRLAERGPMAGSADPEKDVGKLLGIKMHFY